MSKLKKLYVARDYNGKLYLHYKKPRVWGYVFQSERYFEIDKNLYPKVTFEKGFIEINI